MLGALQTLILPQTCAGCGRECSQAVPLCRICALRLSPIPDPVCSRCGQPLPVTGDDHALCSGCLRNAFGFDRMRSTYIYSDTCKTLLQAYKFGGRWSLGSYLSEGCRPFLEAFPLPQINACIPVPSPLHKHLLRPYNPAELLARAVSKRLNKPMPPNPLLWRKHRPPQHRLDRRERRNLDSSYFRVIRPLQGQTLLLVDDIITTGATVDACSRALKAAGAEAVFVITIARTPLSTPHS